MAKDPAFLFYSQDFITGTMFMSDEETGKYVRLLCAQHQKGGLIDKTAFNLIVGNSKLLREKFIETEDGFFNERLMEEMVKRQKKSSNLSDNAKTRWSMQKQSKCKANAEHQHIPPEDEDESESKDINNKGKEAFVLPDWIPEETWKAYLEIRNKKKAAKTVYALNLVIKELQKIKKEHGHNPVDVLNKSIKSGWTDVYPLKDGGNNGNKSAGSFKKFSNSERSLNPEVSERAHAITREYLAKKAKRASSDS